MQKLPRCRKHIRKNHRLVTAFKMRAAKGRWLNTHLWAAKRMKMVSYSGFKIAETPNDKSFRSAYRHFRHNACLMDYSYLQCLVIQTKLVPSNANSNEGELPKCIKLINCQQIKHANRLYFGELYSISWVHD
jgi:hypothetical protein